MNKTSHWLGANFASFENPKYCMLSIVLVRPTTEPQVMTNLLLYAVTPENRSFNAKTQASHVRY